MAMVRPLTGAITMAVLLSAAACAGSLRVGVAKAAISPEKPGQFIGGWGENRVAIGNHDDVWTRAMAISDGETTVVFVANDLVGLFFPVTREIAGNVEGAAADNIVITCTHVHSAPDVLGLWGPDETTTGVDPEYLAMVKQRAARVINAAIADMRPAKLRFAKTTAPEKTGYNANERDLIDREISIMQAVSPDGEPICTLVNYACHPEVLRKPSPWITSDFVHYLREQMEAAGAGDVLFANGALGGMVTPEIEEPVFEEAERIGKALADAILDAMKDMPETAETEIRFRRAVFDLPMENPQLEMLAEIGVLDRKPSAEGTLQTTVVAARIGPAQFATMPGEPLPVVGLAVKDLMNADFKFLFGLADDELGYLLHAEAVDNEMYEYEQSMSVNKNAVPLLMEQLKPLIEATE